MTTPSFSFPRLFSLTLCTCLTIASFSAITTFTGCAAFSAAADEQLMAQLEPAIRQAAEGYIGELSNIASMVSGIKSIPDAVSVAEKAAPLIQRTSGYASTLNSASPGTKDLVRRAFATKLKTSNGQFADALTKLSGQSGVGPFITPALERIPMFK